MTEPDVEQNRSLFFSPLGCLFAQCGTVASQAGSEMLSTHPVPSLTAQGVHCLLLYQGKKHAQRLPMQAEAALWFSSERLRSHLSPDKGKRRKKNPPWFCQQDHHPSRQLAKRVSRAPRRQQARGD